MFAKSLTSNFPLSISVAVAFLSTLRRISTIHDSLLLPHFHCIRPSLSHSLTPPPPFLPDLIVFPWHVHVPHFCLSRSLVLTSTLLLWQTPYYFFLLGEWYSFLSSHKGFDLLPITHMDFIYLHIFSLSMLLSFPSSSTLPAISLSGEKNRPSEDSCGTEVKSVSIHEEFVAQYINYTKI